MVRQRAARPTPCLDLLARPLLTRTCRVLFQGPPCFSNVEDVEAVCMKWMTMTLAIVKMQQSTLSKWGFIFYLRFAWVWNSRHCYNSIHLKPTIWYSSETWEIMEFSPPNARRSGPAQRSWRRWTIGVHMVWKFSLVPVMSNSLEVRPEENCGES